MRDIQTVLLTTVGVAIWDEMQAVSDAYQLGEAGAGLLLFLYLLLALLCFKMYNRLAERVVAWLDRKR